MPEIAFDRYLKFDDITKLIRAFESEFPNLVSVSSIGKSFEGRDIWIVTVTNIQTGNPLDKPAFWADGNIHASEVSASAAVLHLLNKVCTKFGSDEQITRLLDTRTLYLVPRLNPDGAEWSLESPPKVVRSSTRPYPYEEEDIEGLERKDLDDDGRILSMRIQDANGPWKVCETEPRILVRREPTDEGGTYYRLLPEGLLHNWDGITLRAKRIQQGLDMNRNFPSGWRQEHDQYGAGPYPTSEPEIRAAVQAIVDRPNICGAVAFHTFSGVHLRPPSRYADDEMPSEDLWAFQKIGQIGTEMTGYPAISTYHEFRYHPKEVITGVFDDWMYEHRGVFPWITEIWSPQRQAGITDYKYIEWFREHPIEDDIKLLKWSDDKLDGLGHIDWKPFKHPQLGDVEIGGWDAHLAFRNPPTQFLEAEISPLGDWIIWQALCSPKLELREVRVEPAGTAFRVRAIVQNVGWLPTNVTERAKKNKLCRGVRAEISSGDEPLAGVGERAPRWLHGGKLRQDAGQLVGRNHVSAGGFGYQFNDTSDVAVFEWIVSSGTYSIAIEHERAGTIRNIIST
jgi:murein tripeptide amidase MpaA